MPVLTAAAVEIAQFGNTRRLHLEARRMAENDSQSMVALLDPDAVRAFHPGSKCNEVW